MTGVDPRAAALVRFGSEIARRALKALCVPPAKGYLPRVSSGAYDLGHADGAKINPYAARVSRMLEGND